MVKCNGEDGTPVLQGVNSAKLTSEDIIIPHSTRKNSHSGLSVRTSSNASSYGFRLQEQTHGETSSVGDKLERDTATSVSAYSTYKQRIDSMFDETRSQMSCYGVTNGSIGLEKIRPVVGSGDDEEGRQKRINNTVQARIEKMFAEMAKTGGASTTKEMVVRQPSSNASSPTPESPSINSFAVDYLGSVPLPDKVTSLHGLQEPLKDLYFAYCRAMETQHDRVGSDICSMRGTLEINSSGLKVHHKGQDKGELEQLNPFPTIAVWAAVKFVCRVRGSRDGGFKGMEYAFLPLIADPEAIDKGALFQPLNPTEEKTIVSTTRKGGVGISYNHHSPMFAVVMRKMGVSKQLECHGFVCACSEDAIVIAANLYQALMNNMQNRSNNNANKSSKIQQNRPASQNGVNYVSLGGDSSVTGDVSKSQSEVVSNASVRSSSSKTHPIAAVPEEMKENLKDKKCPTVTKIPPPVPVRPPRKNKKSSASSASEEGEDFVIQKKSPEKITTTDSINVKSAYKRDDSASRSMDLTTQNTRNTTLETANMAPVNHGVRRTVSDRQNYGSIQLSTDNPEGGDILTKVAIPRSRSFLNAGGPLTRYNRRQGSGVPYENNGGGSGGSPLGFNELFTEFQLQEGLNSMDDILDAIIDAEGMSFNDLKPIYKEFLMKLAVTLTKDELYQRSKSIMRKQKKKLGRRNSCYKRKRTFVTSGGGLKRVFRRSVNKLKPTKSRFNNFEFTSVLFPSDSIRSTKKASKKIMSLETSSTSTSSYSTKAFKLPKQSFKKVSPLSGGFRLQRKPSASRRRSMSKCDRPHLMTSTSEDSDFFSMVRCGNNGMNSATGAATTINSSRRGRNRSSSGYFSCSECSYDSESCTCISADKCYCSLADAKKHPQPVTKDLSMSSCGCDTDSCIGSDKCYCAFSYHNGNRGHHHIQHKHCIKAILDSHPTNNKPNHLRIPRNNSVTERLKQRRFVASESSLSRAASPTTAWRRNENNVACSKKKDINAIKSSKNLEFLQNENPPTFHPQYSSVWDSKRADHGTSRRMDVYELLPRRQSYQHSYTGTKCTQQRRSYSSDNLALDYDLFTTTSKSEDEEPISQKPQRKVLVVSARDPRGRVIYMGASCRSDDRLHSQSKSLQSSSLSGVPAYASGKSQQKFKGNVGSSSAACEALSVKKSAEIAALFSDVKLTQTSDTVAKNLADMDSASKTGEVFYNTLEPPDYFLTSKTRNSRNCIGSSLENSLGYLP